MTNNPDHHDDGRDRESRRVPHADGAGCCCGRNAPDDGPPFGLPVLAEVPELAGLLEDLAAVDRLLVRVIDALILAEDTSLSEAATGLPLERWIAGLAGRTRSDRRMLQTAAQACRRLPGVHGAFRAGRLSWAQLRAIALRVQRLPRQHDQAIDDELTRAIGLAGARPDPDSLLCVVTQVLDAQEWSASSEQPPEGVPEADFLAMQPRLDGTGGTLYGDFGPEGFAAIDNRLAPETPDRGSRGGFGADADPERGEATGRQLARSRAAKLVELCTTEPGDGTPAPASYVVRLDAETLFQLAPDRAGRLLTTLTSGSMWLDADAARTLADRHGTSLRLVLHDQGRVVGVGRRTEKVPGWLAEATLAVHDTCTAPGCGVAARLCDTDHALPYSRKGRTDVDNLAPLCATDNRAKEPDGWRCTQHSDGRRTWHHRATGLTTTTLPTTWRPPPDDEGRATRHDEERATPGAGDERAPPGHGDGGAPPDRGEGRAPRPSTSDGGDPGSPPDDSEGEKPDDLPF